MLDRKSNPESLYVRKYMRGTHQFVGIDAEAFANAYREILSCLQPLQSRRKPEIIISLTSYPPRIARLYISIFSLLRQRVLADRLILWLAEEEFPRGEADLPENLLCLKHFGLEIAFCENIKSYKKIIPALRQYPEAVIITVDDDWFYPVTWLGKMLQTFAANPNCIAAYRVHHVTFDTDGNILPYMAWEKGLAGNDASLLYFQNGCGGVLYPPGSLYKDVTRTEIFSAIAPNADDIWLWGMAVRAGWKIHIVPARAAYILPIFSAETPVGESLFVKNGPGGQNDIQLSRLLQAYPTIRECLAAEKKNQPVR